MSQEDIQSFETDLVILKAADQFMVCSVICTSQPQRFSDAPYVLTSWRQFSGSCPRTRESTSGVSDVRVITPIQTYRETKKYLCIPAQYPSQLFLNILHL